MVNHKSYLLLVAFLFSSQIYAQSMAVDPFTAVEHIKYDNGLEVFLAPSSQATNASVRLDVHVGWMAETPQNLGISHLLEHTLFRDKQLKDEMTYLQLIREAGGHANGSTTDRTTSYFGSIPAAKASWLLESISKMILEPTISDEYVNKERGTVELERGEPGPVSVALGFNPLDYIYPKYLQDKSFWSAEFGVDKDMPFTLTQEQLSTRKLTTSQVKQHYQDYYYPGNMRLFVTGNYKREEILDLIQKKWASLTKVEGKVLPRRSVPNPRNEPYVASKLAGNTPYVYLGTKLWDIGVKEDAVISSYTEYLAHNLMKEIRNLKGQTYTAQASINTREGYGYAYVTFQTQKENLKENLNLLKKHLHEEAEMGQLSVEKMKEAVDLYMNQYSMREKNADAMMDIAQWYEGITSLNGHFESPFLALKNTTPEEYNAILKKSFTPEKRYQFIYEPYYFFYYDIYFLLFLVTGGTFFVARKVLTKEFDHAELRWVRKVKFPPFKSLELLAFCVGYIAFIHIQFLLEQIFSAAFLQENILLSQYLHPAIWAVCILLTAQGSISVLPSKLMLMDKKLVVKSVSYFSKHFPQSQINKVEKLGLFSLSFWKIFFKTGMKFRFYYYNPLFWRPGVAFHLKNNKVLYFSVSDAEAVVAEVNGLLSEQAQPTTLAA